MPVAVPVPAAVSRLRPGPGAAPEEAPSPQRRRRINLAETRRRLYVLIALDGTFSVKENIRRFEQALLKSYRNAKKARGFKKIRYYMT